MPTTIITKYGSGAPTTSDVVQGELAVDTTNKRLYTQDGSSVIELGTNPAANVTFGDDVKAIFGADSDLQIYHDGSHSYVSDQGTGNLRILAQNFTVRNPANNESMIIATPDAGVTLYYDNSSKFATTSTGIDVTGTVTADGLTVDGGNTIRLNPSSGDDFLTISQGTADANITADSTAGNANLKLFTTASGTTRERLDISFNGDISFYEDTGTTAKLFWDASAESLGIGTTTPAQPIEILKTSAAAVVPMIQLRNGSSTAGSGTSIKFMHSTVSNATSGTCELESIRYSGNLGALTFKTSNNGGTVTERMRIDDTGVGIGTSSPSNPLHIDSGATTVAQRIDTNISSSEGNVDFLQAYTTNGYASSLNLIREGTTNTGLAFKTTGSGTLTERMRIDSSGNVGIGESDPGGYWAQADNLVVGGTGNDGITIKSTTSGNGRLVFTDTKSSTAGLNDGGMVTYNHPNDEMTLRTAGTDRVTIDSSGNLLVGTTTTTAGNEGMVYFNGSSLRVTRDSDEPLNLDRLTSDGTIVDFRKDGSSVGSITANSGSGGFLGIKAGGSNELLLPLNSTPPRIQPSVDDSFDIGTASARFDDIYATNGTIQTSDRNEKQDIEALSEAEQRVAVAAKGLLRKFRWISSVEENGDDARIHFGIIAQDLQAAFEAEGLDAGRYAMFINSTWTDEETGEERSRMGVRYSELLAFIIAAI